MSVYFYEPFYNFDRFFDEAFARLNSPTQTGQNGELTTQRNPSGLLKPRMDLHENEGTNTVTATFELPGLKKEDVQIDIRNGVLSISGESKQSSEHNEEGYAVKERRYGKFSRSLRIPRGVKEEEVKASLDNGVLTVTFPKTGPEDAPKRIAVL